MRLKKLELHGFKSFAEKVVLNFDADVIALVGPNGCGKSNIVDAILWVLGEQSPKSLRAEKMQDVLFAGAENLAPFNLAEVSLTFTDANSPFGDEITISRRAYRDGDTQYLINKKEVRLKDVEALFLGTGIGKHGLFVFEQGKIDEIINMSPEKRRSIFEETAGISLFLKEKKETKTKLNEVEANYNRLKDLHLEVERNYNNLQKKAAEAKSYKANKEFLDTLEKKILAFKFKDLKKKIAEIEVEKEGCNQKIRKGEKELHEAEKKQEHIRKTFDDFESERKEIEHAYFQVETSIKLTTLDLKNIQESLVHFKEREKKVVLQKEKVETKKRDFEKEKTEEKCAFLEEESKKIQKQKNDLDEEIAALEKETVLFFNEEKKQQKALLEEVQKEKEFTKKVQERELKIETLIVSGKALNAKIVERNDYLKELAKKGESKKEEVSKLLFEIEAEKKSLLREQEEASYLSLEIEQKKIKKEELIFAFKEAEMKEKGLLQLQDELSGFSKGAKELLKVAKDKTHALFGKVEELYKHLAIEEDHFLGLFEETLLVKNREDLDAILEFSLKKNLGDFSLLLLEDLANFKSVFLLEKPKADIRKVASQVHKQKEVFVTPGFYINRYGVIFFRSPEKSLFSRLNEIKQLKKVKADLEKAKALILEELDESISKKKAFDEKRLQNEQQRQKKEILLLQENFYLQRLIEDQKETETLLHNLNKEKKEAFSELDLQKKEIQLASNELSLFKQTFAKMNANLAILETKIREKREESGKKIKNANEVQKSLEKVSLERERTKESLRIFEIQEKEEKEEKKRIEKELIEIEKLKKSYDEKSLLLETNLGKYELEKLEKKAKLNQLDEVKVRDKNQKSQIDLEIANIKKSLKEIEKQAHKIELILAEKRVQEKSLLEKGAKDDLVEFEQDFVLEESEKKAYHLRLEIENSTVISTSAIEECEQEEKRFQELEKQLTDISVAKQNLEKIIAKLDKESRLLLKTTFDFVRKNFQANFKTLFNGGEADLAFTEKEDYLDSGVEIYCKPPGKKMRSLSLLSGGEKCLTTLALLFALFEVKPAPFCILDEVDAPLDEANVSRFTSLLKQFVPRTQFIMVTHNKKTMSVADILVGVSMEKRGVSKLVTLGFSKIEIKR